MGAETVFAAALEDAEWRAVDFLRAFRYNEKTTEAAVHGQAFSKPEMRYDTVVAAGRNDTNYMEITNDTGNGTWRTE